MPILFDKVSLRQHRDRAAANYGDFSFLKDEAAIRVIDRLELVRRDFDLCLDFGCHDGVLSRHLAGGGKIGTVIHADLSPKFATNARTHPGTHPRQFSCHSVALIWVWVPLSPMCMQSLEGLSLF